MIEDFLKISLKSIRNKGIRSWLTVIGIVIGIAAIVSLISLGQGLQDAINQQFAILGPNLVFIRPGGAFNPGGGATKLTDHDIRLIKGVQGVSQAGGMIVKTAKVKFRDKTIYTYVAGIDPGDAQSILLEGTGIKIEKGEPKFKPADTGKAAVGYSYWGTTDAFGQALRLGDKITINDRRFTVSSFISKIGNPQDDSNIYIVADDAKSIFDVKDDYYEVMVRVKDGFDVKTVADKIKEKMRVDRGLKKGEEDYSVMTLDQVRNSVGTILTAVQAVVVGIALISLLVGGVNIMNSMYTSVLERTREIGVMKAIGARNSSIVTMFVMEAGIIGLIGGLLGVAIGGGLGKSVEYITAYGINLSVNVLGTQIGITVEPLGFTFLASVTPELVLGALSFSFIVGVIFGFLPAKQASELNPVDALRYE